MTYSPELLAPAGNLNTGIIALDHGADAVYAGLSRFNARERTENFTEEELSKLVNYAHRHKRKVYVTLNTLIKESELADLFQVLESLALIRPDAIIIQDLGILNIVKKFFPSLNVHASTQMGLHNSSGLQVAKQLGIKRVILERQVTLAELKQLVPTSPVELEVFVHGALCCSLSGNCLFSSWFGGWSGNRGKCKQPCRRRFYGRKENGFFFSTKDLYSLDLLSEYKKLNIASLKIEGRLKKADYVKSVVTAYRMVLDNPEKSLKQAKHTLNHSFGRKWSHGFATQKDCQTLIDHKKLGSSGQLCGKVIDISENGFTASLSRSLQLEERIRIQPQSGEEGPSLTLTRISVNSHSVKKAGRGKNCFIHCNKPVPPDGLIYKIGEKCDDISDRLQQLTPITPGLTVKISITSQSFSVMVQNATSRPIWQKDVDFAPAKKQASTQTHISNEFLHVRSALYEISSVKVQLEDGLFIPASVLKKLRKEFTDWLDITVKPETLSERHQLKPFNKNYKHLASLVKPAAGTTILLPPKSTTVKKGKQDILCKSIYSYDGKTHELLLPSFCSELDLPDLKQRIEKAVNTGIKRFRVTSLYALELLKAYKHLTISLSYPLPISNSMAVQLVKESFNGVRRVQAWLELESAEIEKLRDHSVLDLEIYRFGKVPLLATRAVIPITGKLRDSRGYEFTVIKDKNSDISYLYPKEHLKVPPIKGTCNYYDYGDGKTGSNNCTSLNFDHEML